ncbi:MAG: sulfate reduction electron transfer complex DsrMKJOP subunit DsrJ [Candidatus Krumholzibacteriia bacterium]
MYDAGKVMAGLAIFVGIVSAPLWYGALSGQAGRVPEVELAPGLEGRTCVRDAAYMRANHMDLLNHWRDRVVREGERIDRTDGHGAHVMSLQNTCMGCHSNQAEFCDRCHDYMGVQPYCWECHVEPTAGGVLEREPVTDVTMRGGGL